MTPSIEGKPAVANMGARTEVSVDELRDIEQLIVKIQVQMEGICSSELSFEGDLTPDSQDPLDNKQLNCRPEALRVLASKQETVKAYNELALIKLRNLIPRQKGSAEEVTSNMNLKRSRPLSPLYVPRVSSIPLQTKLADGEGSPRGSQFTTSFDIPSSNQVDMLPLKFIRTGENTKAPYQKPSTIFMPTAKLGAVGVGILDVPPVAPVPTTDSLPAAPGIVQKASSPRRRPCRSRRGRTRNKVAVLPEPVIQTLMPGDTNKIPEDGYLWRKYGNKPIKTASYKRGYYKCRHFKEVQCNATKIVQPTNNDPNSFTVHYKGEHTCSQRGNRGGVNGGPHHGGSDTASLADQVNENMNMGNPRSPEEEKDDALDGLEWPRDDDSDSVSEDILPSSEGGEDAVDSVTAPPASEEVEQPASPLLSFDMPDMEIIPEESLASHMPDFSVETHGPWAATVPTPGDFNKLKYEDTCPPDTGPPEIDQNGLLLELINCGLMGDNNASIHDISYWYPDLDTFSHFASGSPLF